MQCVSRSNQRSNVGKFTSALYILFLVVTALRFEFGRAAPRFVTSYFRTAALRFVFSPALQVDAKSSSKDTTREYGEQRQTHFRCVFCCTPAWCFFLVRIFCLFSLSFFSFSSIFGLVVFLPPLGKDTTLISFLICTLYFNY